MEIMSKEKEYKRRLKYIYEDVMNLCNVLPDINPEESMYDWESINMYVSNIECASNLKDKEYLSWKTKFDVPTHDPQTGELNPHYEELTGKKNPLVNPDLIIISSGYDCHYQDPLGGLKFTTNFFGEMIKKYKKIQPKIVCTLEGGYNLNWIGKCLTSQIGEMTDNPVKFDEKVFEDENVEDLIKALKNQLGNYWKI